MICLRSIYRRIGTAGEKFLNRAGKKPVIAVVGVALVALLLVSSPRNTGGITVTGQNMAPVVAAGIQKMKIYLSLGSPWLKTREARNVPQIDVAAGEEVRDLAPSVSDVDDELPETDVLGDADETISDDVIADTKEVGFDFGGTGGSGAPTSDAASASGPGIPDASTPFSVAALAHPGSSASYPETDADPEDATGGEAPDTLGDAGSGGTPTGGSGAPAPSGGSGSPAPTENAGSPAPTGGSGSPAPSGGSGSPAPTETAGVPDLSDPSPSNDGGSPETAQSDTPTGPTVVVDDTPEDVVITGLFSPGHSPGIENYPAGLDLSGATRTLIEIAGLTPGFGIPGGHDQVNVEGLLTLGGVLDIDIYCRNPDNGCYFEPSDGDIFTIFTFGSLAGAFSDIIGLDLGAGLFFDYVIDEIAGEIRLETYATLQLLGGPEITGQFVPASEPATLAIFGLGLLGLGIVRRRRRSS